MDKKQNFKKTLSPIDVPSALERTGGDVKGASANLSLIPLQEASFEMENAGRERNIEKAKKALELLEEEYERLQDFLAQNKGKNQ